MNYGNGVIVIAAFLLASLEAAAQQPAAPSASDSATSKLSTVHGCLNGERGNYILIEDNTGLVYVLRGVGNKLDAHLHHEVEVKGRVRSGTIKTGINPSKAGSNPSDTIHGVDGVPFEVANVQEDVRTVSKHCKAADQD